MKGQKTHFCQYGLLKAEESNLLTMESNPNFHLQFHFIFISLPTVTRYELKHINSKPDLLLFTSLRECGNSSKC